LEAAESLGIPVWRFRSYQPGTNTIEVVPVGKATISPASEKYVISEHCDIYTIAIQGILLSSLNLLKIE
jgi:hypothetical protein